MKLAYTISKKQIADSFNRVVDRYDTAAVLQRMTADTLIDLINQYTTNNAIFKDCATKGNLKSKPILEIGTGTGYLTALLRKNKFESVLLGVDMAEKMIKKTKQHSMFSNFSSFSHFTDFSDDNDRSDPASSIDNFFLCADGDFLPLQNNTMTTIISNLCLQWCPNLVNSFSEYFRILQDPGILIFATLGPKTLFELRSCWNQLDAHIHINHFISSEILQENLVTAGFSIDYIHSTVVQQFYPNLIDLMKQLKALGAQNLNQGRHKSLTGKNKFKQLITAYEVYRATDDPFNLLASYEVIYVIAKKLI